MEAQALVSPTTSYRSARVFRPELCAEDRIRKVMTLLAEAHKRHRGEPLEENASPHYVYRQYQAAYYALMGLRAPPSVDAVRKFFGFTDADIGKAMDYMAGQLKKAHFFAWSEAFKAELMF